MPHSMTHKLCQTATVTTSQGPRVLCTVEQACLVGSNLYVFGGEDHSRRPLCDLHVLHLDDMCWEDLSDYMEGKEGKDRPQPRTAHAATIYQDKYLVLFGGVFLQLPCAKRLLRLVVDTCHNTTTVAAVCCMCSTVRAVPCAVTCNLVLRRCAVV